MKRLSLRIVVSLLGIILALTACGSKAEEPPEAVLLAQYLLSEQLSVPMAEVKIVSFEEVEWSDSCFGLGGPAEICAAEVTTGWQMFFEVNGEEYEVRSNQTGTIIRTPQL